MTLLATSSACTTSSPDARDVPFVDLAEITDGQSGLVRVFGSVGEGSFGLPVAGGEDLDGDGWRDAAFGAMRAPVGQMDGAGQVFVWFGDGELSGRIDSAEPHSSLVRIEGQQPFEYTGSELWMDDVTGDGVAELLVARQNHSLREGTTERIAAGALSIIGGGAEWREGNLEGLLLGEPTGALSVMTLVGATPSARLGIWMRTGDVTGDGIRDIVVGADQEEGSAVRSGVVYVVAGGEHLSSSSRVDLSNWDESPLSGLVARLSPPASENPERYHFGATCQLADLDENGRAEVLIAAALERAGAALDENGGRTAEGRGGAPHGTVYIAWDDNFPDLPWAAGFSFALDDASGAITSLRGGDGNNVLGEEMLAGVDWDDDGAADLFLGDLTANLTGSRASGAGHVLYDAARLRGLDVSMDEITRDPSLVRSTTLIGIASGDIFGDTATAGDFDGDGVTDLAVSSPHASPLGRGNAGIVHVLYGQRGGWPSNIDLARSPDFATLVLTEIYGANGRAPRDRGDTLSYSAASGDFDGDGRTDLVTNEMVGNGLAPGTIDVGNLIIVGGERVSAPRRVRDAGR